MIKLIPRLFDTPLPPLRPTWQDPLVESDAVCGWRGGGHEIPGRMLDQQELRLINTEIHWNTGYVTYFSASRSTRSKKRGIQRPHQKHFWFSAAAGRVETRCLLVRRCRPDWTVRVSRCPAPAPAVAAVTAQKECPESRNRNPDGQARSYSWSLHVL